MSVSTADCSRPARAISSFSARLLKSVDFQLVMPRILTDTTNADVVSTRDGRHKHDSAVVAAAAIVILGASEQCAVEVIHPVQVRITEPVNVAGDGVAEIYLVTEVRIQLDPEPVTVADGLDAVKVSAPGLTDARRW